MKVKELMKLLKNQDPEAKVYLSYNYGDRGGNQVAEEVYDLEDTILVYSAYHDAYKLASGHEEDIVSGVVLRP